MKLYGSTLLALLIAFFLLGFTAVLAQQDQGASNFNANLGFQWLTNHCPQGNCKNDIMTTAFYTLALKSSGALDYAAQGLDYIKSREDRKDHCWPANGCKIQDTVFALAVLNEYGEDTAPGEEYLKGAISAASDLKDFWYLEVITSNNGTCKVSYQKTGESDSTQKDVFVEQGSFPECTKAPVSTFFDLNACLEPNLLTNNPSLEIDVNCNDVGPSTIISIIFTKDSSYYLIEKASSPRQIFTIENGCFGAAAKSSCTVDNTLYANWILSTIGSDIKTKLYLQNKYDKFKAVDNALLYLSTPDKLKEQYLKDMVSLQRNDGSFNKQIVDTAIAILALKTSSEGTALNDAITWLQSKQKSDGSWDTDELKTAVALYAAFSGAAISLPPLGGGSLGPIFDCGDGFCDLQTENANTCPSDCRGETQVCEVNGVCETFLGENSLNCAQDCICGDSVCDNTESSFTCAQDCGSSQTAVCGNGIVEGSESCDIDLKTGFGDDFLCPGLCQSECTCGGKEEKSGFPWWISVIIVILLAGLIIFYVKVKGSFKKKPASRQSGMPFEAGFPSSPPPASPPPLGMRPSSGEKKSKIDEELDKSIAEAKKLLKKL